MAHGLSKGVSRQKIYMKLTVNLYMSVIKSIELVGSSPESFEKAISNAVDEAKKTVRNLRRVEVDGMEVLVENDQIVSYQAKIKLYFLVER